MRISDWSSDVCSSDLALDRVGRRFGDEDAGAGRSGEAHHFDAGMRADRIADGRTVTLHEVEHAGGDPRGFEDFGEDHRVAGAFFGRFENHRVARGERSEEHTSELQSLMRFSYAVF